MLLRPSGSDHGLLLARTAPYLRSINLAAAAPPPPPTGLDLQVIAEWVDADGVKQTATADNNGSITITGLAPLRVWFDASGSRSDSEDDASTAWTSMNYRFDMGEATGETWSLTGDSKDVYEGAPAIGHVYEEPGTFTKVLTVRSTSGLQGSLSITVEVGARGAGTDVALGGSWPTMVSGGVYNLANGDHSAKGQIPWNGMHNVLVRAQAGATPTVSNQYWDSRGITDSVLSRTRACAFQGITIPKLYDGLSGSLYCSVVGGHLERYEGEPIGWYFANQSSTENERNNLRYPRGLALWDCGVMVSRGGDHYVHIGSSKNFTLRNVDLNKTSGDTGQHVFRGQLNSLDIRSCRFRVASGASTQAYIKVHGFDNSTFDEWHADDRYGVWNVGAYNYVAEKISINGCILGASGSNNSVGSNFELMPENNDSGPPPQGVRYVSVERVNWYATSGQGIGMSGQAFQYHDNKHNLGAGSEVSYYTNNRPNRTPAGWGGYVNSARPTIVD
jgi:hypothetical protein